MWGCVWELVSVDFCWHSSQCLTCSIWECLTTQPPNVSTLQKRSFATAVQNLWLICIDVTCLDTLETKSWCPSNILSETSNKSTCDKGQFLQFVTFCGNLICFHQKQLPVPLLKSQCDTWPRKQGFEIFWTQNEMTLLCLRFPPPTILVQQNWNQMQGWEHGDNGQMESWTSVHSCKPFRCGPRMCSVNKT